MYNSDYLHNSQCDYNMLQFYSNSGFPTQIYHQPPPTNSEYKNDDQINTQTFHNSAINQRKSDTQFITNFIDENTNICELKNNNTSKKLNISETKALMVSVKNLTKNLKELVSNLENEIDLSEEEWLAKKDQCQEIKSQIEELSQVLHHVYKNGSLQKMVMERKKKRMRHKKLKNQWKATKLSILERRFQLHAAIDAWIQEKQNVIERERQEESFRKDADMILSDIRGKRSDARKYLATLRELQNLRKVKANNARARGEKLSPAADQAFENIIVQLTEQWSKLDREYTLEEQGLKLMLKNDNENVIAKQKKNSYNDWEIVIFGRKLTPIDSVHKNINNFLMTRYLWDRYIDYEKGKRIPIGWVMPTLASSSCWERCLKQKKYVL